MVDILSKYHTNYKNFFTKEECDYIIQVFEEDKDSIPYGDSTGYHGLTSSYTVYNWLDNPKLKDLKIEERIFELPEIQGWSYATVQCWGNRLEQGHCLSKHIHGQSVKNIGVPNEQRRWRFYNANIFLGGEYKTTWYDDIGEVENTEGDIHVFASDLEHGVDFNTGNDIRYSMAIDIHPTLPSDPKYTTTRYKSIKNPFKRYRDTTPMRFYTARALFALDYHNQQIMDEMAEGNTKNVEFHMKQREKLIEWSNNFKDHILELEEQNRAYGIETKIPPFRAGTMIQERSMNQQKERKTIFKHNISDYGIEKNHVQRIAYRTAEPSDIANIISINDNETWDKSTISKLIEQDNVDFWIQEYKGNFSGFSVTEHNEERTAHILSLITHPDYRNKGLADNCIKRIIDKTKSPKIYFEARQKHSVWENNLEQVGVKKDYYGKGKDAYLYGIEVKI